MPPAMPAIGPALVHVPDAIAALHRAAESWNVTQLEQHIMRDTRSLAPLQWIAHQMGCDLTPRSLQAAELAAAKARVAELERAGRLT